jgi:hypothetical protein
MRREDRFDGSAQRWDITGLGIRHRQAPERRNGYLALPAASSAAGASRRPILFTQEAGGGLLVLVPSNSAPVGKRRARPNHAVVDVHSLGLIGHVANALLKCSRPAIRHSAQACTDGQRFVAPDHRPQLLPTLGGEMCAVARERVQRPGARRRRHSTAGPSQSRWP